MRVLLNCCFQFYTFRLFTCCSYISFIITYAIKTVKTTSKVICTICKQSENIKTTI